MTSRVSHSLFVLFTLFFGGVALPQNSNPSTNDRTRTCWGWIKGHSEIDGGTVREIRGQVVDPAESAVAGALIEVFAYTDPDLDKRIRVGYKVVGADGKFHFRGLRSGKYELRGSYCKSLGFDAGHTIVTLRPRSKNASLHQTLVTLNISQ